MAAAVWMAAGVRAGIAQIQAPGTEKHLLQPPKTGDVASVCDNELMLAWGSGELYLRLNKDRVMEFLSKGEVRPMDAKLLVLAPMMLPDSVKNNTRLYWDGRGQGDDPQPRDYYNGWAKRAEGVIVTKGYNIFFYRLMNDRVLDLTDDAGGECALVLGPDAGRSAKWLTGYHDPPNDYDDIDARGAMPVPKPEDVMMVVNRTDASEINIPVRTERIKKLLAAGKSDRIPADDRDRWGFMTLPARIESDAVRAMQTLEMRGAQWPDPNFSLAAGVMALRNGEPVFWNMVSDFVIYMTDSRGRSCTIRLHEPPRKDGYTERFGIDGYAYESHVPLDSVRQEADWSPEQGPPALGEKEAAKLAWKELTGITGAKGLASWHVMKIDMAPMWDGFTKWYYAVRFVKKIDAQYVDFLPAALREVYRDNAVVFISMEGMVGKIENLGNGE